MKRGARAREHRCKGRGPWGTWPRWSCEIRLMPSNRRRLSGTWCSGITSASHAEGPGFNPQCVHFSTSGEDSAVPAGSEDRLWMTTKRGAATVKTVCPSGLRGWTQVPLAKAAWVQIPQLSLWPATTRGKENKGMAGRSGARGKAGWPGAKVEKHPPWGSNPRPQG